MLPIDHTNSLSPHPYAANSGDLWSGNRSSQVHNMHYQVDQAFPCHRSGHIYRLYCIMLLYPAMFCAYFLSRSSAFPVCSKNWLATWLGCSELGWQSGVAGSFRWARCFSFPFWLVKCGNQYRTTTVATTTGLLW